MMLLQLSAGQGPEECCQAVGLAMHALLNSASSYCVVVEVLQQVPSAHPECYKSVLLQLSGDRAQWLSQQWQGVMQWVCVSEFRPNHKRKNWFFSGETYLVDKVSWDAEIRYQACRASGAGGQHVNTTDSAVRATHLASGLSVRVESERSQHANKRLASALLFQKLQQQQTVIANQQAQQRWQQHNALARGNPVRTFVGRRFILR